MALRTDEVLSLADEVAALVAEVKAARSPDSESSKRLSASERKAITRRCVAICLRLILDTLD